MGMLRRFGWLPDPPSPKDHDAAPKLRTAGPLPTSISLANQILSILDQGNLGSCVAQATAQALRASLVHQGVVVPTLASRSMIYYLARAEDGTTQEDAGTNLRQAFDSLRIFGYCPEVNWPYIDSGDTFKRMPSAEALNLAYDQRGTTGFSRITSEGNARVYDVKSALAAGHCVVFGTEVGLPFCDYMGDPATVLNPPAKSEGGHALTIAGYDAAGFRVVNSWNEGWGARGWCTFSPAYIAWSGSMDFWIVDAAPNFSRGVI